MYTSVQDYLCLFSNFNTGSCYAHNYGKRSKRDWEIWNLLSWFIRKSWVPSLHFFATLKDSSFLVESWGGSLESWSPAAQLSSELCNSGKQTWMSSLVKVSNYNSLDPVLFYVLDPCSDLQLLGISRHDLLFSISTAKQLLILENPIYRLFGMKLKLADAMNANYVIICRNPDNTKSYHIIQKSSFEIFTIKLKCPGFQHLYKPQRWKSMVLENQGKNLMTEVRRVLALLCICLVFSSVFKLEDVAVSGAALRAKCFFPVFSI